MYSAQSLYTDFQKARLALLLGSLPHGDAPVEHVAEELYDAFLRRCVGLERLYGLRETGFVV